ncbi:MAG: ATP-binding protein [Desulfomonile tiedjei]|nr:ATP-binding protein [Desulfomonile tiedjei]
MNDKLIIQKLGPIKHLEIEPRPLTILIGEQASGKSLAAQVLYFFRGLKTHLAKVYTDELAAHRRGEDLAVSMALSRLRGVSIEYFANGTATLQYRCRGSQKERLANWQLRIDPVSLMPRVLKELRNQIRQWFSLWGEDKDSLKEVADVRQIFIPTERSLVTRFAGSPHLLYAESHPEPLRQLATLLEPTQIARIFRSFIEGAAEEVPESKTDPWTAFGWLTDCERKALGGEAVPEFSGRVPHWEWRLDQAGDGEALPMSATSSGQMETWPFFAIARCYGALSRRSLDFYFEEPETHLHPSAQVEVMKAVAYLINRKAHSFFITTHSPYLLYVVNNMIQRHVSFKGKIPEGEERWLDPSKVAAYRLRQTAEPAVQDIVDRNDTQLIDAEELESVANELGGEFNKLLYGME